MSTAETTAPLAADRSAILARPASLPPAPTPEALRRVERALADGLAVLRRELHDDRADAGEIEYASWLTQLRRTPRDAAADPGEIEYASWLRVLRASRC